MAESLKQSKSKKGILFYRCPACLKRFKFKAGRRRHPRLNEVDKWLEKAQCPSCGQKLRVGDPQRVIDEMKDLIKDVRVDD